MTNQTVTIIIATTATETRFEQLKRAIESVLSQQEKNTKLCVVVNGTVFSEKVVKYIRTQYDIEYHYRKEGNVTRARHYGRTIVKTPFFGYLDDDDYLFNHAISGRLQPMLKNSNIDVIISNGYRNDNDTCSVNQPDISAISQAPFTCLLISNWLTSCSALYRTSTINDSYFTPDTEFFEWFHTAVKLLCSSSCHFINNLDFNISNTESSISKSCDYALGQVNALESCLKVDKLPDKYKRALKQKLAIAQHDASTIYLSNGEKKEAWIRHLKSLKSCKNLFHYLPYTRKLL